MSSVANLSGAWELDSERSDSLYSHMKALGCEEIAALASDKLHLRMHVIQTESRLHVWQRSQLGIVHRSLHVGQETQEVSPGHGHRKVLVTVSEQGMNVHTTFRGGEISDTRTLETDRRTGDVILVVVILLKINEPEPTTIRTKRCFRRIGDPDPEIVNTPLDGIATSAGLPPPAPGTLLPIPEQSRSSAPASSGTSKRRTRASTAMRDD